MSEAAKADWQGYAAVLKEVLQLEYSPVAVRCVKGMSTALPEKKVRICRAILDAGKGETISIDRKNNACFGAAWHLGFHVIRDARVREMTRKFVVEGEKLFSSYEALDRLMSQLQEPADNSGNHFVLSPLERAEAEPGLVIFICNAEAACRLLTLAVFLDGKMPRIQIGGPTCRMSIVYPMAEGEVNISFYDYTARKICSVEKDKLLVSVPFARIPAIVASMDSCSGGRAKIEFPQEFREFLRQRLVSPQT